MESDTVLVTDMDDNILQNTDDDDDPSTMSKMTTHRFTLANPRGILHRAFSVFLFDISTCELLLQKRASTKITFPNVWTNTCCSHPLFGMDPPESELELSKDDASSSSSSSSSSTDNGGGGDDGGGREVDNYKVRGAMNAAIRKLRHELGISPVELSFDSGARFKYLTRVHYWAADTITHGNDSPWGEHEIDYILFVTVPNKGCISLDGINDDEVDDVRWVDRDAMRDMFEDGTLLFSPWFRIIADRWLMGDGAGGREGGWWDDLNRTMNTNDLCDFITIHRFDPPREHMGGAGDAGPMFID
jgi:isopentenyl-diphosphate delta-isomerase type 1